MTNFKRYRKLLGIKQVELARLAGVSAVTIAQLESLRKASHLYRIVSLSMRNIGNGVMKQTLFLCPAVGSGRACVKKFTLQRTETVQLEKSQSS